MNTPGEVLDFKLDKSVGTVITLWYSKIHIPNYIYEQTSYSFFLDFIISLSLVSFLFLIHISTIFLFCLLPISVILLFSQTPPAYDLWSSDIHLNVNNTNKLVSPWYKISGVIVDFFFFKLPDHEEIWN